jgi:hypothetical protein
MINIYFDSAEIYKNAYTKLIEIIKLKECPV